ncbi:MAG: restriction endonuclease subunit S [Pseudomonadota bacterium]|nr:restriction endonuclease subunit S [Pseudomonadota bacterium]
MSANEFETAQVDGELSESYELVEGDILTVRSNGNKRLIGRCALVEKISHKTSFSGFIIRIRLMSQNIDPKFLTYYLKSSGVHEMLIGSGGGANISNLNQQTLTRLPVTYPPLDDQLAIVTMLGEIKYQSERLIDAYLKKLGKV